MQLVFRSFFILMAVLVWIGSVRMVPLSNSFWNEKVYWPKSVVQVLLFLRNSKSAIFYFNRFRFPLESDVRRNSFFDCTGSLSFICFFLTCFPGNDDSGTLSEFSGKLPLHCTLESVLSRYLSCFIFLHETVLAIFWRIEIRDTHLTWVSFSARFGCFLLPSKCGSLFFNFILTV